MMLWDPFQTGWLAPARSLMREVLERPFELTSDVDARVPALALHSKDDGLLVRALVPGVRAEDLDVRVEQNCLVVRGSWGDEGREGSLQRRAERARGTFTRVVRLSFEVEHDQVKARLERGVLEVELPRAIAQRPLRIQVTEPEPGTAENRS